jgi:hypothetical protein
VQDGLQFDVPQSHTPDIHQLIVPAPYLHTISKIKNSILSLQNLNKNWNIAPVKQVTVYFVFKWQHLNKNWNIAPIKQVTVYFVFKWQ